MNKSETQTRKKLIEHSLPLDAINAASSREKSIRHGHPSTLHLWWARRPLAACRAVLFGQLVDDPSAWPERFPTEEEKHRERRRLHDVIKAMVEWPKSTSADQKRFENAIDAARWEIARSTAWGLGEEPPPREKPAKVLEYLQAKAPPVYDPFCGGGSIPLEAQRLGLRAYGSDLNPVAVLITKALIEFPPKFAGLSPVHPDASSNGLKNWKGAQGLAEDVRRYGQWMREEAEKRIGHLYPKAKLADGTEATVIAWLWARTVASPDPAQKGAHVPLASSFVLSSREDKEAVVVPIKEKAAQDGWRFEVKASGVTKAELASAKDGTKSARGANFVCVLSGTAIDGDYIKAEGTAGRMGARLMAVVAEGDRKRDYLAPTEADQKAAELVRPDLPELDQSLPDDPRNFWTVQYGLDSFGKLFTPRQLTALTTFSDLVGEARKRVLDDARASKALGRRRTPDLPLGEDGDGPVAYADAVATYLAFAVDRVVDRHSSIATWDSSPTKLQLRNTFARQAIPMTWDYGDGNMFASSSGAFEPSVDWIAKVLETLQPGAFGRCIQVNAPQNNYPVRPTLISTDPPYYDNIGYADLADFFYVWLRRSLKDVHPDQFRRLTTPKTEELVATPYRHSGKEQAEAHFMKGMGGAIRAMNSASTDAPLAIYYAFKQSEVKEGDLVSPGWAAFLQAVVDAGLQVDGTWPIRTELSNRMIASGSNALAASVVLVCRKRHNTAPATNRREFLRELKPVMDGAIRDHQKAGIPLPDRRQAAIGPGIGVFSKYSIVREADDSAMRVATALALINKEIDALLAEGTEDLDAETRFALEWYQMHGFQDRTGCAGDAIAQLLAFNLAEARINATGIFRVKGGDAKLLTRDEMRAAVVERYGKAWRPSLDDSFTVWELAQHMARTLGAPDGGIDAAGRLLAERRSAATDVLLIAERLFELATTRGENEEALVWNELQISWPEIENAADRAQIPHQRQPLHRRDPHPGQAGKECAPSCVASPRHGSGLREAAPPVRRPTHHQTGLRVPHPQRFAVGRGSVGACRRNRSDHGHLDHPGRAYEVRARTRRPAVTALSGDLPAGPQVRGHVQTPVSQSRPRHAVVRHGLHENDARLGIGRRSHRPWLQVHLQDLVHRGRQGPSRGERGRIGARWRQQRARSLQVRPIPRRVATAHGTLGHLHRDWQSGHRRSGQ